MQASSGRHSSPLTLRGMPASQKVIRPARWAARRRLACPGRAITMRAAGRTKRAAVSQTRRGTRYFKGVDAGKPCAGSIPVGSGRDKRTGLGLDILSKKDVYLTYKCEPRHGASG